MFKKPNKIEDSTKYYNIFFMEKNMLLVAGINSYKENSRRKRKITI